MSAGADAAAALTVRHAVREALTTLPAGRVLVAVSGGADSVALLAAALAETAAGREGEGLVVGALTVDHGLQDGSAERARAVAATAESLGADPVEVLTVEVGGEGGPEAAARRSRYDSLAAAADRLHASAVLLGHTLDDQAETVLLGLARGSGARSLSGMPPRRGRWVRPLLGVRRAQTRAACAAFGVPVWDDPHNSDPAFARVRVRQQALPALEAALGPSVPEALARTADLLRADADALDEWARRAGEDAVDPEDGTLAAELLAGLPDAVRTRVLRRALVAAGVPAGSLTAAHVASVDRLLTDWRGQGAVALPGRVSARRSCGRLHLAGAAGAAGTAPSADGREP